MTNLRKTYEKHVIIKKSYKNLTKNLGRSYAKLTKNLGYDDITGTL